MSNQKPITTEQELQDKILYKIWELHDCKSFPGKCTVCNEKRDSIMRIFQKYYHQRDAELTTAIRGLKLTESEDYDQETIEQIKLVNSVLNRVIELVQQQEKPTNKPNESEGW